MKKQIIEDKITIYTCDPNKMHRRIYSNLTWFNVEYYIIEEDEYCLTIRKCYLEIPDNTHKISSSSKIGKNLKFQGKIPDGNYMFDEEDSTEDELIIYYS